MQNTAATARRTVNVKLTAPVEWLDKVVTEVEIREPSAAEFFEVGPPQIYVHGAGGGVSVVDSPDALAAYVRTCVRVENAGHFLRMLPLADGRAIKTEILGFFRVDSAETTPS